MSNSLTKKNAITRAEYDNTRAAIAKVVTTDKDVAAEAIAKGIGRPRVRCEEVYRSPFTRTYA